MRRLPRRRGVIKFIQLIDGVSFAEAVELLVNEDRQKLAANSSVLADLQLYQLPKGVETNWPPPCGPSGGRSRPTSPSGIFCSGAASDVSQQQLGYSPQHRRIRPR